ncbi:hypothetical protein MNO14_14435 [Luteimonas sp. S4-F44]|uniref:hypothetical protein n=1 Tax=Luteimonas sp. S4-F44 TaxID=2925842 RepID=UPI001F534D1A|nr:hypothetical protein [Luteimonas sp. S4-F44]UNK42124.1 hypothetical protein MNO14_14435 [Luteimonas sp. S4-F44]
MNTELRKDILLATMKALWGEVFPKLRAVVCFVKTETEFEVAFFVDGDIEMDEQEAMQCVVTEVIADFPANFLISEKLIQLDAPAPIPTAEGLLVFLRKES